ncbi:hypothetical protein TVAG_157960 [Trichomonas vaginalis G3]|uniref:Uncharacterized protein n=1 Tax=Trichomonas vaginalis (strain ATCC PRA-98 / G3) TaxID=412133 RepID=A2FBD1_TRIV3|nr:hypothetical protein TVAGG3_0232080 [Trichomonas vaginalis G3]EAX97811.1 hypothetical protein TVAG_157960 [Trichomonas vaginalis G3]KAI5552713.1 hypothetical protein TVAGG3_0232080 [Trichomonas vaginalis G3]|eukprot:XP_001310741.1 hypothetical protein [Trichomonas vaginalis G3]
MEAELSIPEFEKLKEEVDHINEELGKRTKSFTATVQQHRIAFDTQCEEMENNFKSELETENSRHDELMKKMQNEIKYIETTVDTVVRSEVGKIINDNQLKQNSYNELLKSFNRMKKDLETELAQTDEEVSNLNAVIKEMEKKNTSQMQDLEKGYRESISEKTIEHETKKNELLVKNKLLQNEIAEQIANHQLDTQANREKLLTYSKENELIIQREIDAETKKFNDTFKQNSDKFFIEEAEAKKQTEESRKSNTSTIQRLTDELNTLKSELSTMDIKKEEQVRKVRKEVDQQVADKEAELKQLQSENKKAIEQERQKMSRELIEVQKKHAEQNKDLEKQLIDASNQAEISKKQLEGEVNSLIRQKARLEQEFQELTGGSRKDTSRSGLSSRVDTSKKSSRSPLKIESFDGFSVSPATREESDIRTIGEMTDKFDSVDSESRAKLALLNDTKKKNAEKIKKARMQIENQTVELTRRRDSLKGDIVQLNEKLKAAESKAKAAENGAKSRQKLEEASLRSKINMQKDTITNLKEECQKLRVDANDVDILTKLQNDYKVKLMKVRNEIDLENERLETMLINMKDEFETDSKHVKDGLLSQLETERSQLDNLLQQLASLSSETSIECEKDAEKWGELRTDIAQKSTRMVVTVTTASNNRGVMGSKQAPRMSHSRQAPLPPLRA